MSVAMWFRELREGRQELIESGGAPSEFTVRLRRERCGCRYRGMTRSEGVKELTGEDWDKSIIVSDTRMATSELRSLTAEYKPMVELTVRAYTYTIKGLARGTDNGP